MADHTGPDTGPDTAPHRRRRRRRPGPADAAVPEPQPAATPPADRPAPKPAPKRAGGRHQPREANDRGLRDIVGAGRSQLGVEGALRGRDVNRPTAEDIAEAEQNLVIVRRHWTPPPNTDSR